MPHVSENTSRLVFHKLILNYNNNKINKFKERNCTKFYIPYTMYQIPYIIVCVCVCVCACVMLQLLLNTTLQPPWQFTFSTLIQISLSHPFFCYLKSELSIHFLLSVSTPWLAGFLLLLWLMGWWLKLFLIFSPNLSSVLFCLHHRNTLVVFLPLCYESRSLKSSLPV